MWASIDRALVVMARMQLASPGLCQGQAVQSKSDCEPDASAGRAYTADFRYTSVSLTADGKQTPSSTMAEKLRIRGGAPL